MSWSVSVTATAITGMASHVAAGAPSSAAMCAVIAASPARAMAATKRPTRVGRHSASALATPMTPIPSTGRPSTGPQYFAPQYFASQPASRGERAPQ